MAVGNLRPEWGFEIVYWVPEGSSGPDIPWPNNWECCGYPYPDPFHLRSDLPRRKGWESLNMPMYGVTDLHAELAFICTLVEALPEAERAHWDALQDRQLIFGAGRADAEGLGVLNDGFSLPVRLLHRLHGLGFRLTITLQFSADSVLHVGGGQALLAKRVTTVLDRERVEKVLRTIWREYMRDFEITPITEIQDIRAFSILWAAVFLPECISKQFQRSVAMTVLQYRDRADYSNTCWFRVLPIEAALYALTGSEPWLSTIRANLDHHKSSLRTMTIESFAVIADRLEFDGEILRRIAHNLEVHHSFCEWPVILFAVSRGTAAYKRQKIEEWLGSYEMNENERAVLETLARGELVDNPFLHRALRVQQFLTLRMARAPLENFETPEQLRLDDEWAPIVATGYGKRDQMQLFADETEGLSETFWARVSGHPLTASMIRIEDRAAL
jgi:hypothetical protein